jgi:hypothetical protein
MSLDLLAFNRWDIVLGARFVGRPYSSARSEGPLFCEVRKWVGNCTSTTWATG